jgi:hypothetical protein
MNDTTRAQDESKSGKPDANPSTVANRPDTSPPDTTGRPAAQPERIVKPGDRPGGKDDSALESLGKAFSAPVLDAADENPDAPDKR